MLTFSHMKYFAYHRKSQEASERQVLSIPAQKKFTQAKANELGLNIVGSFDEAGSAKEPGRPIFNEMIERIESGEADGVLCWKLDRLARNPVDAGTINWMIQGGSLSRIITSEREYQQGDNVLMMTLEFGVANQFIIDLKKNVKRGMSHKVEGGWFPGLAPIGYLNAKYLQDKSIPIAKDKDRWHLVREVWDLALTGKYSVPEILRIANEELGLRTFTRAKCPSKPLSRSALYGLLHNHFYCGMFKWRGELHEGKHEPMITFEEFQKVQAFLGRKGSTRTATKKVFPYTGLLSCGECGCSITAEEKVKYVKSEDRNKVYRYYRCTKKKSELQCQQKCVREEALESQLRDWLSKMSFNEKILKWTVKHLHLVADKEERVSSETITSLNKALQSVDVRLNNLLRMKISAENVNGVLLSDEEYLGQKTNLTSEKTALSASLADIRDRQSRWLELAEQTFNFACHATRSFDQADLRTKKDILLAIGARFVLHDGVVSIEAKPEFQPIIEFVSVNSVDSLEPALLAAERGEVTPEDGLVSKWYTR